MKKFTYYQIDTFTNELFKGNPAGVCPLDHWIDDELMQSIAFENNLSETTFYVKKDGFFEIRWFTPTTEVDLCGHATLAAAFVEFNLLKNTNTKIVFSSRSGNLTVIKNDDLLTLDFPVDNYSRIAISQEFTELFNIKPLEAYTAGADVLLVFNDEISVKTAIPCLEKIQHIKARGITITAKGDTCDFVSRFFGPQSGINEDSVTGSTHTYLTPYWSTILKKDTLIAKQLSNRGGKLTCSVNKNRVEISGTAKLYLEGVISTQ